MPPLGHIHAHITYNIPDHPCATGTSRPAVHRSFSAASTWQSAWQLHKPSSQNTNMIKLTATWEISAAQIFPWGRPTTEIKYTNIYLQRSFRAFNFRGLPRSTKNFYMKILHMQKIRQKFPKLHQFFGHKGKSKVSTSGSTATEGLHTQNVLGVYHYLVNPIISVSFWRAVLGELASLVITDLRTVQNDVNLFPANEGRKTIAGQLQDSPLSRTFPSSIPWR